MPQEKTTKEKLIGELSDIAWYSAPQGLKTVRGFNSKGVCYNLKKENIIEILSKAIDQTREEMIRAIPEEMKHNSETDSEESKTWIAGFNNCRNQILNKLKK